jgi:hypothetical protein
VAVTSDSSQPVVTAGARSAPLAAGWVCPACSGGVGVASRSWRNGATSGTGSIERTASSNSPVRDIATTGQVRTITETSCSPSSRRVSTCAIGLWNDPTVGLTREDAGKLYNAYDCLRLAHDIAIVSKHVVIDRPRIDPNARLVGQDVTVLVGTEASFTWRIEAEGKVHDGYGLARNAFMPGSPFSSNGSCCSGQYRRRFLRT